MIKDPYLLLSVVNTALRDRYNSLQDYCFSEGVSEEEIIEILKGIGYTYNEEQNTFKNS